MADDVITAICDLLESGERAQRIGDFSEFNKAFEVFDGKFGLYTGCLKEWVHYIRYFVDCWIDASNHDWLYHEPITENDWAKIATQIKQAVASGNDFEPVVLRGRILNNDY